MNQILKTLTLPLKSEYFNAIKSGAKLVEYRLRTPFWIKRIEGKEFDIIALSHGYPRRAQNSHWLFCKWQGYTIETIQHPHFGPTPVEVFSINVRGAA